ncbi:MAG: O-antigen ligase family protein [Candidatus Gracilibacteria bacterium]|nr:O-antigen ligase family protein [Candidatus Gracilibacteria bacterium]MDD5179350.1 O-antigen ligase family protein [Candidatus Gracilibacteria bacterium]
MKKIQLPKINLSHLFQAFFGLGIFLLPLKLTSLVYTEAAYSLNFFNTYAAFFLHASILSFLIAFVILGLRLFLEKDFRIPNRISSRYLYPFFGLLAATCVVIPFAGETILALLNFWQMLILVAVASLIAYEIFPRYLMVKILVAAFSLEAVIGIGQFIAGGDLSLHFLGESYFNSDTFNVAKIALNNGITTIRAMGTLPHANILGGLSAIVLLLLAALPKKNILFYFASIVILAGMFFSFSRAGYFAFFVGLAILTAFEFKRRMISSLAAVAVFLAFTLAFGGLFFTRLNESNADSVSRFSQIQQAVEISISNPLGVGSGDYTNALAKNYPQLPHYQIQPAHNFFILKLAEESLLTVAAWLAVFASLAYTAYRRRKYEALAITIAIFILMQFDHYFATNFTGEALLWLALGFVLGEIAIPFEPIEIRKNSLQRLKY